MSQDDEKYNADELETPVWLNKDFFKEILAQYAEDPNVQVTSLKLSPATLKGDHYFSVMFRALVEYKTQHRAFSKSMIIKTIPDMECPKRELFRGSQIFPTEIIMYTEVLPKIEKILSDAGENITLCARCIYHTLHPRQVIIFEDLVARNYEVIRKRPARLPEIKNGLEKLAKLQAVSYKLLKDKSEFFNKLQYDLTTIPNVLDHELLTTGFSAFLDSLDTVESLKEYRKYFEPMKSIIIKRWSEIIREFRDNPKRKTYYVLCHGDFTIKNTMFKDNDCLLLDFQFSYVGSMTNDILYAIYMFLGPEERRNNYDELIFHYFTTFTSTLSLIGYKGKMPSIIEFRKQLFDNRYLEICLLSIFMPTFNHLRKGRDPSEFMDNAQIRHQCYYDKEYQEELEFLLPRMLHLGYFDQLK